MKMGAERDAGAPAKETTYSLKGDGCDGAQFRWVGYVRERAAPTRGAQRRAVTRMFFSRATAGSQRDRGCLSVEAGYDDSGGREEHCRIGANWKLCVKQRRLRRRECRKWRRISGPRWRRTMHVREHSYRTVCCVHDCLSKTVKSSLFIYLSTTYVRMCITAAYITAFNPHCNQSRMLQVQTRVIAKATTNFDSTPGQTQNRVRSQIWLLSCHNSTFL